MTILQITSSSSHSGGTRQALMLCEGLRAAGHRVLVVAPPHSRALLWAEARGMETRTLPFGSLREQWRAGRALRALAGEEGVDVVHTHHTKAHNAALLGTFGGGFPPVVANRGVLYRPECPAKFRSRRTGAIVTNSRKVKEVLVAAGIGPGKIHVVYNAKDVPDLQAVEARAPSLRSELALAGEGPVIGAVGSGDPHKGFRYLVEAAPAILGRHPGALFVLVGNGTEGLLPLVRELGIEARFRITGYREDVVDLLGLFDLFILPSVDKESCPNVLLEAMSVGVPCVATDVGGSAELLEGGRIGWLVPPGSPEEIARAVCEALSTEDGGRGLGRLCRRRVEEEYSLSRKVERTLCVYDSVFRLGYDRHEASEAP